MFTYLALPTLPPLFRWAERFCCYWQFPLVSYSGGWCCFISIKPLSVPNLWSPCFVVWVIVLQREICFQSRTIHQMQPHNLRQFFQQHCNLLLDLSFVKKKTAILKQSALASSQCHKYRNRLSCIYKNRKPCNSFTWSISG